MTGHPRSRRARLVLLLLVSGSTSACYTYRPLVTDALPVGTRVEAELTDRGGVEIADSVGGTATRLSGRVQRVEGERVILALNRVTLRQGRAVTWAGEPVGVPTRHIASVRSRKFSWWRTAIMGTLVTTGFVAIANKLGANIGWLSGPLSSDGGGGPGTGQ